MADETPAPAAPAPAEAESDQPSGMHDGKPVISVKVYAPFQVFFEGEAYSLSAINETGPFDILPKHHNFLCMLVPCDLVIRGVQSEKTIKVHRALMHVKANRVVVFMDV
jgi:F0F1-type ATP synthase epsilon subunit